MRRKRYGKRKPLPVEKARGEFMKAVCVPRGRKPCRDCMFCGAKVCISETATATDYRQAIKEYQRKENNSV